MSPARVLAAWHGWLHAPVDPRPLAAYRVAFGLLVAASALAMAPDWLRWFGPEAVVSPYTALRLLGGARLDAFAWLPATEAAAWAFLGTHVAAALALAAGWRPRLAALVVFLTLASMHHRNPMIFNAGDALMRLMAAYLAVAPAAAGPAVPAWGLRLMQLQVALVYLAAGLEKLGGATWRDGTAVYYAAHVPNYAGWPVPWLLDHPAPVAALTWGTIALEIGFALLVWWRPARPWLLGAMAAFHLGLAWAMNLPVFQWLMLAGLLLFVERPATAPASAAARPSWRSPPAAACPDP